MAERGRPSFRLAGLGVLVALLCLWELASRTGYVYEVYFPPITRIAGTFLRILLDGTLVQHMLATLGRFGRGYLLAAALAVSAGLVLGYWRLLFTFFEPLIEFMRPMPSPAIIPIAILLFGIGDEMKIFVTLYACSWPILLNTIDGVRSIDRTLFNTALTFGLGRWELIRKVVIPAASPQIVTGLRISLAIALILVTTAEMVVSNDGLGFFILDEQRSFRIAEMYAGIFTLALLGYTLNRVFLALDARVMGWHRGLTKKEIL
ncbi:MAG: ABC transporter permease [Deltaproteobacteria bacterium]|nr:ABC transporter permease [Deltaproteobacteria bacterium]MBI3079775.1 ABC transporter permease [Deltaproteobacteria bacterium]